MARVIEEEKEIRCSNCNTRFVYSPKDIRTTFITNYAYVECPVCGSREFIV